MKAIDAWVTDDGKIFDDEDEAIKHERREFQKKNLSLVVDEIYNPDVHFTTKSLVGMILDNWDDIKSAVER